MAIMQSCCFWQSVRSGSYASAIYSAVYFAVIMIFMSAAVEKDLPNLIANGSAGNESSATQLPLSFLEPSGMSNVTVYFNVVLLGCGCCGFLSSMLLCCGLYTDNRLLLLPWIMTMLVTSTVDLNHIVYLIVLALVDFYPLVVVIFTIDFFILALNIYCWLCVVSQYQEYLAGRGTARHRESSDRLPVIRYEVSAKNATSSRRNTTTLASGGVCKVADSEEGLGERRRPTKRVQFPEEAVVCEEEAAAVEVTCCPSSVSATLLLSSSSMTAAAALVVDTAPLLSPRPPPPDTSKLFFGP